MCTHPLLVSRKYAGKISSHVVPCGKCHECLAKHQAEFAALSVLEAQRSKSMYMVTFTYSNSTCPIMFSQDNYVSVTNGEDIVSSCKSRFVTDKVERLRVLPEMLQKRITSTGKVVEYLEMFDTRHSRYVPSLDREGMRLFLKRVRISYVRSTGVPLRFRYAAFGEYGDAYHRPHFHFLFYDLEPKQVRYICEQWSQKYGFADFREVPLLNKDGSPARVMVSKYVSKYVSKPKKDFEPLLKGWVEAPRRFSSLRFGLGVLDSDKLKSFIYAKV